MSSLVDYLDKGASLGRDAPCLIQGDETLTYGDVQDLSRRVAGALKASGVGPGDKVGVLSSNDARAFACVFGIARLGAVWCPINPRNETAENRALLELFDCDCLIYHPAYEDMVREIPLRVTVRLDELQRWLAQQEPITEQDPPGDLAMLVGTGGTTGLPKGVMLTARNLETMTALTLMGYPFDGRPAYLALAPLTHAAGVLCFPVMALGGRIVVMPKPDLAAFLEHIERHRITHTFLPPTLIYVLLGHPDLDRTDLSSLQCFWYGAAPMSTARLEEALEQIGPMAQLFGQSEAPMMVSMLPPAEHFNDDGTVATHRLASAGRPAPLVQVQIMDQHGTLLGVGERGEIVVRGSLVMAGYYKDPEATAAASKHGWHHTGDIGYLDDDGYLFIVDRLKDMIITGGFNVYSAEVEQALMQHPAVRDCAVIGLPDEKWGERVEAVVELKPGVATSEEELIAFVKERIGSVKAPKGVEIWDELPRSKVGKVLKAEVRASRSRTAGTV